jgi:glycosyltransferase involved in cell wall biosynthesis
LKKISTDTIDVLVVNDCSKDKSSEIAHQLNCVVLDLPVNLGIGGAMQCGYKYAHLNNYDIAVQMDGDGQHPPHELVKLITEIEMQESDIVIGSRFIEKQGFQSTFFRRFGIKYFKWLNNLLAKVDVNDSTSGFRAFNKRAISLAVKYYPDEYPEPESIIYFSLYGLKVKEVPVVMKVRQGGVSSISPIKSIYYMWKVSLGIIFIFLKIKFSKRY